jgi:hypothetical protein
VAARVLDHEAFAHVLRARIDPQRVGHRPVVVGRQLAVEDAGGADVQQRDVELVGDVDRVLHRHRVGAVGVVDVALAVLEAGVRAQMEQQVGREGLDVGAVGRGVAEVQVLQPGLVEVDVGAAQFVVVLELLVEGFAEHAAAAGHVDLRHEEVSPERGPGLRLGFMERVTGLRSARSRR